MLLMHGCLRRYSVDRFGPLVHLVVCARPTINEAVAELDRRIIDKLSVLKGFQFAIPTVRRYQVGRAGVRFVHVSTPIFIFEFVLRR